MGIPEIIAEVGVNFYDTAKKLNIAPIDAAKMYIVEAKRAGADIVKFQSYKAGTLVSKNSPAYWDLSKEPTKSQYELFKKHDSFNHCDFEELKRCCDENGIGFMSTPFDFESADFLNDMMEIFKISSSDITNLPFLRHIAAKGKPVYLSTGASYISEIDTAVRTLADAGCPETSLLHCILCYPTKYEDANLNMISHLKSIYPDFSIGYSDHTAPDPSMTVLTTAFMLGADIIEKHFTLDKTLSGNDHYHAMDPHDLKRAVDNFRLIQVVGGMTDKTVISGEMVSRREARRSIVLTRSMTKGERISPADISLKRPGNGIGPENYGIVIGRLLAKDLDEDTVLTWEMI